MASENIRLKDILTYEKEDYLSESEIEMIRNTFKYNPALFTILRKVFIPTFHDIDLPVEEMGRDVWMTGVDFQSMQADEIKPIVLGRQEAIKFVLGGLISLKNIAFQPEDESEEGRAARTKQNSSK